ncbi:MAG: MaoC family dehydratase [Pseudolabrys sp.]
MLVLESAAALQSHAGTLIGVSGWRAIDQKTIDLFAEATGDHQWIHTDVTRAARELPGGKTIAHGYLLLALVPSLFAEVLRVEKFSRSLNYGLNKVRFTAPVPRGARVRLALKLAAAEPVEGGIRFVWDNTLELEGSGRPAMVAQSITLLYD